MRRTRTGFGPASLSLYVRTVCGRGACPVCASWNQLDLWLRAVDALRRAALSGAAGRESVARHVVGVEVSDDVAQARILLATA